MPGFVQTHSLMLRVTLGPSDLSSSSPRRNCVGRSSGSHREVPAQGPQPPCRPHGHARCREVNPRTVPGSVPPKRPRALQSSLRLQVRRKPAMGKGPAPAQHVRPPPRPPPSPSENTDAAPFPPSSASLAAPRERRIVSPGVSTLLSSRRSTLVGAINVFDLTTTHGSVRSLLYQLRDSSWSRGP